MKHFRIVTPGRYHGSMKSRRLWIEAWAPEFGASVESERLALSDEKVSTDVETERWAPLTPDPVPWPVTAFVDGVHRVDARAYLETEQNMAAGLLASTAAGSVITRAGGRAIFGPKSVRRTAIFGEGAECPAPALSGQVWYESRSVFGTEVSDLVQAIQAMRSELELELARELAAHGYLVIADGPLLGRREQGAIVGMIKSHQKTYLTPDLEPVVRELAAGQRTPLFHFGQIRPRYSWYLRLAETPGQHPWAGVVRCEVSATLSIQQALELANLTACHLLRFASRAFWDNRAPQNLVPIATLERHLWHLMGDREILLRHIRSLFMDGALPAQRVAAETSVPGGSLLG